MGDEGAAAPAPEPPKTTTSGAQAMFQTNAWLTAAAVAVYTTKALWVKLREMGLGKTKSDTDDDNDGDMMAESENNEAKGNPIDSLPDDSLNQGTDQSHSQLVLMDLDVI